MTIKECMENLYKIISEEHGIYMTLYAMGNYGADHNLDPYILTYLSEWVRRHKVDFENTVIELEKLIESSNCKKK